MPREILITSALLYANGDLHLGHMVEAIQADIWARFQRLRGHTCHYVSGEDAHGTPIMIHAEKRGLTPEALIAEIAESHKNDLSGFLIQHDQYGTTHSDENRELTEYIYEQLQSHIETRRIAQFFDPEKSMFLPDRFVKGTCPKCGADDQYGDNCEQCGATYAPTELKDPRSILSGATPVQKESEHYFFRLGDFENFLKEWINAGTLQPEVSHKLKEWFEAGLQDWDISRDAPYFGFEIPGAPNKYFYVWLDAPIGYMAAFKKLCAQKNNLDFDHYWQADSTTELYHFIGKDIVYFHGLFWPAMLNGAGFRTPTAIFSHGFLTINGTKMSKSRGTLIRAQDYLKHLEAEYLRYYFASKLTNNVTDIDLNWEDFRLRINSDLVGKVVNIASRCAGFIHKSFEGKLANTLDNPGLFDEFVQAGEAIAQHYEQRDFSHAMRAIMQLADKANQYIDQQKPWQRIKDPEEKETTHAICSLGINLFYVLMVYLKPVLPKTAEASEAFLNTTLSWDQPLLPLHNHAIQKFKPLLTRIEEKHVEALHAIGSTTMTDTENTENTESTAPATGPLAENPIKETITIDDFMKLDLRIAKIIEADHVEGADKLLRLKVDLGGETRQIFAGIKRGYAPEDLVGRSTMVVANLAPRKMRFGLSEGMVALAAGKDGLWLLSPDEGALPGTPVK